MGAREFWVRERGKDPRSAFSEAVSSASWESGHGGYTGTIAEKSSFRMVTPPTGVKPIEYAEQMMEDEESFVQDKWGDAGCVEIKKGEYLFFGFASE